MSCTAQSSQALEPAIIHLQVAHPTTAPLVPWVKQLLASSHRGTKQTREIQFPSKTKQKMKYRAKFQSTWKERLTYLVTDLFLVISFQKQEIKEPEQEVETRPSKTAPSQWKREGWQVCEKYFSKSSKLSGTGILTSWNGSFFRTAQCISSQWPGGGLIIDLYTH